MIRNGKRVDSSGGLRGGFRTRLGWEIAIVLALSYGASAAYALLAIADRLTRTTPLGSQTATLNRSLNERPVFDLIAQLLGIAFDLAPVALVVFLLWQRAAPTSTAWASLPDPRRSRWWAREGGSGLLLAAAIGIPGIGLYLLTRAIGINTTVVPTALDASWWTVPVLLLSALRAALGEELIVVVYLTDRLRRLGLGLWAVILTSALLRGSYHLYQGFGGFIGNVAMGVVFAWAYQRWGRALPLIVAHWVLDVVSFVGYPLAVALWPSLFAAPA